MEDYDTLAEMQSTISDIDSFEQRLQLKTFQVHLPPCRRLTACLVLCTPIPLAQCLICLASSSQLDCPSFSHFVLMGAGGAETQGRVSRYYSRHC
eukprot:2371368-Rhodomonas_salina.7